VRVRLAVLPNGRTGWVPAVRRGVGCARSGPVQASGRRPRHADRPPE